MHNLEEEQRSSYTELFIRFSDLVEWWFKRVIVILIMVLLCLQFLLHYTGIRYHITTIDKLEGTTQQSLNRQ